MRVHDKHTRGWPDREIARIAGKRRTLVTRDQLYALSLTRSAIGHALARRRLHPVYRAVYSLVEARARPPLANELAAVLACGERCYLSHHSAAAVWGVRPPHTGPVDVTVAGRHIRQRDGVRVHSVQALDRLDVRTFDGVPITSPARTLLDIAPDLAERELEKAFDEAIALGVMTPAAVTAVIRDPRPGVGRLRALAEADRNATTTRSEAEEAFLRLIRKAGLPQPAVNARLGRWTVDFLWRESGLVVEVDGHPYHSSRAARERDHRKDAELQQAGLLVIRISARRLKHAPEEVLAQVAVALALRGAA